METQIHVLCSRRVSLFVIVSTNLWEKPKIRDEIIRKAKSINASFFHRKDFSNALYEMLS